jgi:hypothetical protein
VTFGGIASSKRLTTASTITGPGWANVSASFPYTRRILDGYTVNAGRLGHGREVRVGVTGSGYRPVSRL